MSDPISALNHLPSDLIEEVLPFLPPKSLGRFKSVSKRWYSLISRPDFIRTHIRNCKENNYPTHMILVPEDEDFLYSVSIKQLSTQTARATVAAKCLNLQEPWLRILGSCNGLVLASDIHDNLYLVNPTTRESLKVPDSGGKSIGGTYGFGYDFSKDDYKVISYKVVSDSDLNCNSVHVYSLRNNSWNKLPNFPYQQLKRHSRHPGVLLNNNLHYVVTSRHSTLTIAAFSLATEEFHEMELPYSLNNDGPKCFQVFALDRKLVAVMRGRSHCSELWVMEEYGVSNSWKKHSIFQNVMHLFYDIFAQVSNRDILLSNNYGNEFLIHKMDERRCTSVTIEGCQEITCRGTYVESLESLKRFR
ncbi:F-box/kelch-repeat protein At3g06240-like [Rutidosis leptorrhynchoides]|uniref:F-box/kelch-repeat protein At3g06240-like n=1 Tax=Rutidosis leptorrhynchoides TaxID=125765 RepID=UPI003A98ED80